MAKIKNMSEYDRTETRKEARGSGKAKANLSVLKGKNKVTGAGQMNAKNKSGKGFTFHPASYNGDL